MEHENIERVKDRIAKLLRMAADSSSPHEAAIAAQRARSLMDKYQISESDVSGEVKEPFGEFRGSKNYSSIPRWMNILSVAVARFNDCQSVIVNDEESLSSKAKFFSFRGFKNDAELSSSMYYGLCELIMKLSREYLIKRGLTGYQRDVLENFKLGCSSELVKRLNEITKERSEISESANQKEPGTGLCIIKKKEQVESHYGEFKTVKIKKLLQVRNDESLLANLAGRNEARKIQIQATIED